MKLKMLVTDDETPMCFRYLIRKLSQNRYFIDMVHRYTGKDLFIYVRNVRFIFPALIIRNSLSSCCSAEQYGTWGSYCTLGNINYFTSRIENNSLTHCTSLLLYCPCIDLSIDKGNGHILYMAIFKR